VISDERYEALRACDRADLLREQAERERRRQERLNAKYRESKELWAQRARMRETEAEFARQLSEHIQAESIRRFHAPEPRVYLIPLPPTQEKTRKPRGPEQPPAASGIVRPEGITDKQWKRMRAKANKARP
jgi:hypothetical protein